MIDRFRPQLNQPNLRWAILGMYKGQLISKCPYAVFKFSKKPVKYFSRISALASKEKSNQKRCVIESKKKSSDQWHKVPLFFWFDLFSEARAEMLENISLTWKHLVGFLKDLKTPKGHFEINWSFRARRMMDFFQGVMYIHLDIEIEELFSK